MFGDLGKHLHQSRAERENGLDVKIRTAAFIKEDRQF
jgi:hypothetical protein